MADLKISQLNGLAGTSLANNDVLAVVDTSASETKKITSVELVRYGYGLISTGTLDGDIIEDGTTSARGTVQLTDSTSSTSTTTAATPSSVKTAYDLANAALPASGGTISGSLIITSDLTVQGTTTTIDTTTLVVKDKNIEMGVVGTPTDVTADGGGITLRGTTDKTINWVDATDAWTSSERFSVPTGTAAAPTLTFTGDEDTGIYSPSANQVALSTGGTGRLFIDASGNVGIGTSSPAAKLHVYGASGNITSTVQSGSTVGRFLTNSNGTYVGTTTDNDFTIQTNSQNRVTVKNTGNVGIGTSSPIKPVDIQGAPAELRLNSTSNSYARFTHAHSGTPLWTVGTRTSDDYFIFRESGSGNTIIQNGNVGIGTASPGADLEIAGNSARIRLNRTDGTNTYGEVSASTSGLFLSSRNNAANGQIIFQGNGGGIPSEYGRFDTAGRLLVGTSSGTGNFLLQTEGQAGDTTAEGGLVLRRGLGNASINSGNGLGTINFAGQSGGVGAQIRGVGDAQWATNDYPGRLVFSTTADGASSPTERMKISQNGVVTIKNGAVAEIDTLTDGATITPDFAAGCNFTVTLGGNRTIANPSNLTAGQSGSIFLVQDATGSRTVSWGSYWDFPGGTAPTLSTAANAVDRVDYIVRNSTSIHTVFTANYS